MRRHLSKLVSMLAPLPGIRDIGLTTNGILLAEHAQSLFDAGLHRLNVSLDTLDPVRFRAISRRDGLEKVLAGLEAAKRAGFHPIKINAVSIRGITDLDVVPLARFARDHGYEMRFIEYMPIGADAWEREKVYFAHEILEQLEEAFGPIVPAPDYDPRAPAMDFIYADDGGGFGIIASISRPFCRTCNRIRLTAEGKIRNCLFALEEIDVRPLLREKTNDALLAEMIRNNVAVKWEGHEINTARFVKPERTMHAIGG
jgi:cyclic pyranopterin phosphate synthase